MTITAQVPRSGPFTGNGSTVAFTYGFLLEADTELVVVVRNTTTDVITDKILTTDYSVAGVGTVGGGTVTFVTAPAVDEQVAFLRAVPLVQDLDLQNRGVVSPELLEAQLDELTRIVQDHDEAIARALLADVFNVIDPDQLTLYLSLLGPLSSEIAAVAGDLGNIQLIVDNLVAVQNAAANALAAEAALDEFTDLYLGAKAADPTLDNDGNALQTGAFYFNTGVNELRFWNGTLFVSNTSSGATNDVFTGDGATVDFVLSTAPAAENNTFVYIDGVYQAKAGYCVASTTVTFSEAPPLDANIEVITLVTAVLSEVALFEFGVSTATSADGARMQFVETFADLATLTPSQIALNGYVTVTSTGFIYQRVAAGQLDYSGGVGVQLDVVASTSASAYGCVPSDPTAPVYVDAELELAIAGAVAAGEAILHFLPGLHFLQNSHVIPAGLEFSGLGIFPNVRMGNTASLFDVLVDSTTTTTFVACGTGTRNLSIDYVTNGLHMGFKHTNAARLYTNAADEFFEITDFTNQDASGFTPATPRLFSALFQFEESQQRHAFKNIRVIPSCPDTTIGEVEGVSGYKDSTQVVAYADWDVGLYATVPWGISISECAVVGYWGIASHLSYGGFVDPASIGTPNAEHGSYDHCVFQDGVELRSGDIWPIIDKTSAGIYVRWTPSHQFDPAGGVIKIATTDTFGGTVSYEYSDVVYIASNAPNIGANTLTTGWLRLNNIRPLGAGANDTTAIRTEFTNPGGCGKIVMTFAGGHSHTRFNNCSFTDFAHCTGVDEANSIFSALRDKYRPGLTLSGAPMRAVKFSNCLLTSSGPIVAHIGMARDVYFDTDCYAETRPYRTTLGGLLDGVRGGAILAGSTSLFRSETGNAGSCSGRIFGNGFNDVISTNPYRTTRAGTRMVAQLDHFYFGLGFTDIDAVIPNNGSNQLQIISPNAQEIYIARRDSAGVSKEMLRAYTASSVDRVQLAENTVHIQKGQLVRPGVDNLYDLGAASFRWDDVFATNGTINTSDEREKRDIAAIPANVLDAWAAVNWIQFRWKSGTRTHTGVIAQQVIAALDVCGPGTAFSYGVVGYDEWPDEFDDEGRLIVKAGNRYSVRAGEADALENALIRRALQRAGIPLT